MDRLIEDCGIRIRDNSIIDIYTLTKIDISIDTASNLTFHRRDDSLFVFDHIKNPTQWLRIDFISRKKESIHALINKSIVRMISAAYHNEAIHGIVIGFDNCARYMKIDLYTGIIILDIPIMNRILYSTISVFDDYVVIKLECNNGPNIYYRIRNGEIAKEYSIINFASTINCEVFVYFFDLNDKLCARKVAHCDVFDYYVVDEFEVINNRGVEMLYSKLRAINSIHELIVLINTSTRELKVFSNHVYGRHLIFIGGADIRYPIIDIGDRLLDINGRIYGSGRKYASRRKDRNSFWNVIRDGVVALLKLCPHSGIEFEFVG